MKRFGFFSELPKADAIRVLRENLGEGPQMDEERILNYLRTGTQMVAVAGVVFDLLAKDESIIGPPHEFSDGEWLWSADVLHYVMHYHLRVPEGFVSHMRGNNWVPRVPGNIQQTVSERWKV
jgi:hypothetical protein